MAKKILMVLFLAIIGFGIKYHLAREHKDYLKAVTDSKTSPIQFEEASIRRYHNTDTVSNTYIAKGHFEEPNKMHLQQSLSIEHYKDQQTQTIHSSQGLVLFKMTEMSELFGDIKIDALELYEGTKIKTKDYLMATDKAVYAIDTDEVTSDKPVRITGTGKWLSGDNGFVYRPKDDSIKLLGKVTGEISRYELLQKKK